MKALFYQTYIIALPIVLTALLGYIVWLLQEQKKQKAIDIKERNERIEEEKRLYIRDRQRYYQTIQTILKHPPGHFSFSRV